MLLWLCAFCIPLWCTDTIQISNTCRMTIRLILKKIGYNMLACVQSIYLWKYTIHKIIIIYKPNVYTNSESEICFYQHCMFFNKVVIKYQILNMISWNKSHKLYILCMCNSRIHNKGLLAVPISKSSNF